MSDGEVGGAHLGAKLSSANSWSDWFHLEVHAVLVETLQQVHRQIWIFPRVDSMKMAESFVSNLHLSDFPGEMHLSKFCFDCLSDQYLLHCPDCSSMHAFACTTVLPSCVCYLSTAGSGETNGFGRWLFEENVKCLMGHNLNFYWLELFDDENSHQLSTLFEVHQIGLWIQNHWRTLRIRLNILLHRIVVYSII